MFHQCAKTVLRTDEDYVPLDEWGQRPQTPSPLVHLSKSIEHFTESIFWASQPTHTFHFDQILSEDMSLESNWAEPYGVVTLCALGSLFSFPSFTVRSRKHYGTSFSVWTSHPPLQHFSSFNPMCFYHYNPMHPSFGRLIDLLQLQSIVLYFHHIITKGIQYSDPINL